MYFDQFEEISTAFIDVLCICFESGVYRSIVIICCTYQCWQHLFWAFVISNSNEAQLDHDIVTTPDGTSEAQYYSHHIALLVENQEFEYTNHSLYNGRGLMWRYCLSHGFHGVDTSWCAYFMVYTIHCTLRSSFTQSIFLSLKLLNFVCVCISLFWSQLGRLLSCSSRSFHH